MNGRPATDEARTAASPGLRGHEQLLVAVRYLALTASLVAAVGVTGALITWPLLTTTIGPTAYVFAAYPHTEISRFRNAALGHAVAIATGLATLGALGLWHHPPASFSSQPNLVQVAAAASATGVTLFILELCRSHHAPAAATALLIATGLANPGKPLVGLIIGLAIVIALGPLCGYIPGAREASTRDQGATSPRHRGPRRFQTSSLGGRAGSIPPSKVTPGDRSEGPPQSAPAPPADLAEQAVCDVRTGRFERSLAGLAAAGRVTTAEIFTSHDGELRQQDDVVAHRRRPDRHPGGCGGGDQPPGGSHRAAGRVGDGGGQRGAGLLPPSAGIMQKPGGLGNLRYNLEMGPPLFAPLLATLVGGMGILASLLRREGGDRSPETDRRRRSAETPGGQGRFGGFDVLDQVAHWDAVTAGVVLARLDPRRELSFFTAEEEPPSGALFDLLLGPTRRPEGPGHRADRPPPVGDETDGWRYEDMPDDTSAWRRSLAALDEEAAARSAAVRRTEPRPTGPARPGGAGRRPVARLRRVHLWSLWTRYACAAFYSHPWAWNEIGFGGPAYPRGYKNLGVDRLEPWERCEIEAVDPVPWARRSRRPSEPTTRSTSPTTHRAVGH